MNPNGDKDCSKLVLGLWPIAGITTIGVTSDDANATIAAAIDAGITTFDTAFSYGYDGESDRFLSPFLKADRDRFKVLGKIGQRYSPDKKRVVDASPSQLTADSELHLKRLGVETIDVLFLHSPDPNVPLEQSARAMSQLKTRGLCREVGICNMTPAQYKAFDDVCPLGAIQCPLNLIQTNTLSTLIEPCRRHGHEVYVFWSLMKGLLAGAIKRDHQFAEGDSRPSYPVFQGELRHSIHDALDRLAVLSQSLGKTISQLSVGWVTSQPGVTAALIGARRPEQIIETAAATPLAAEVVDEINAIVQATVSS